jgi:four helix bundle protein
MAQANRSGHAGAVCRLDGYRLAVEFDAAVVALGLKGDLRDQLSRASASVALNLAEGYGRISRKDKRRCYVIALGSARECAAALELACGRGVVVPVEVVTGIVRVVRVVEGLVKAMS